MNRHHVVCLGAGLFMGGLLALADHFGVMPWLLGIILATFSYNVQRLIGALPSQKIRVWWYK